MTLLDLVAILDAAKDYGSLIGAAVGIVSVSLTAFGFFLRGKHYEKLLKLRIEELESQVDVERGKNHEMQSALGLQAQHLKDAQEQCDALNGKFARIKLAFSESDRNIWLSGTLDKPKNYNECMSTSIPVILIANLKGGVGKSTIAANLASYFEREHHERILSIDLDYQGSLSSMLLPEPYNRQSRAADALKYLIAGQGDATPAIAASRPTRDTQRDSRIVDADGPFANFETRMQIRWLGGEISRDIRYNLARMLHQPIIQTGFQRIIIDAPPRLTTGFINALCASTHLVVPFVLDTLSAERVGLFLNQIQSMRPQLFPHLKLAGVVGTMKRTDTDQIGDTEQLAFNEAKSQVKQLWGSSDYVLTQAPIPRKQSIADAAGLKIAYNVSPDARAIFQRLGRRIVEWAPGCHHASSFVPEAAE